MINWNDVEVEMKIAQERYQALIEARRVERLSATRRGRSDFYRPALNWLGEHLVRWGHNLQRNSRSPLDSAVRCDGKP